MSAIAAFLEFRRTRKHAADLLGHARHVRNMRGDLFTSNQSETLHACEVELRAELEKGRAGSIAPAMQRLHDCLAELAPRRSWAGVRENFEVLLVALSVAMCFRTYILQPFKIPTGSMQPTLNGIHSVETSAPEWSDRMPFAVAKWIITGSWYREVRIIDSGTISGPEDRGNDFPSHFFYQVGSRSYKVPKDAVMRGAIRIPSGTYVNGGSLLWSGVVSSGDHVFVDKIRWNIRPPVRGNVTVFSTDGIEGLIKDTHYIKRLVGLPGESIGIRPPDLIVNEAVVREPENIAKVASATNRYAGWTLPDARTQGPVKLRTIADRIALGPDDFFVLGDNTMNSRDGRYWGTVPRANLVGPAVFVYWPFTPHWGIIR